MTDTEKDPREWFLKACPFCKAPRYTEHTSDCRLIVAARADYEDEDNEIVIPYTAGVEAVDDGFRVEASVHVSFARLEEED